jgi:serine protease
MSLLQALSRGRLAAVLLSMAGFGLSAAVAAEPGRVIVQFKSDLSSNQRQALSAGKDPAGPMSAAVAREALQSRTSALAQRRGLVLASGHAISDRAQVIVAEGVDSATLASRLAADPEVASVVIDGKRQALRVPNDPLYLPSTSTTPAVGQWYLRPPEATSLSTGAEVLSAINAQGAWDITTGHSSVVVAVLDTGVRPEHPDLVGKLLPGYDMVSDATVANDGGGRDADPSDPGDWISSSEAGVAPFTNCSQHDSSWHGTQTAGLVAAATNNGTGMAGAGWNVKVLPVRVLGKCFGYDSDIIAGMRWAAGLGVSGVPANPNPAKVINLSLGGVGSCTAAYTSAISEIQAAGVVIVAAAGNSEGKAVGVPGNCTGVIAVAAVRHIGTKVGFSDVGPEISIAAPGGNCVNSGSGPCLYPLLTTVNDGTTTPGSSTYTDSTHPSVGTSFSAPLVSATAALMFTANRSLTPQQVLDQLKATVRAFPTSGAPPTVSGSTSTPIVACHAPSSAVQDECYCTTTTCGAGLLDTFAAVNAVARAEAYIDASATTVTPSTTVTLDSASTVLPLSHSASRLWSIVSDPSGIAGSLSSTSAQQVTITPTGAGQFTVRLSVTDTTASRTSTVDQVIVVAPASGSSSGGGGGAMSATWLAALALAVLGLVLNPRRR